MNPVTHTISERQLRAWTDKLCDQLSGRYVLHAGCMETLANVKAKLKKNIWLYQRLEEVCKLQIGLESSPGASEYMYEYLGFAGVIYEDLFSTKAIHPIVRERQWDCMILGAGCDLSRDVTRTLQFIHARYGTHVREIVITTPGYETIDPGLLKKASFTPVPFPAGRNVQADKKFRWFNNPNSLSKKATAVNTEGFRAARF